MKSLTNMNRLSFTNDIVMDLIKLYQFRGKDFFYEDILKSDMDYIIKQTIERDTFFANKILNLNISENRLRLIIQKNTIAKNKDEQILTNLKLVFQKLQEDVWNLDLTANEVLRMSQLIYKGVKEIAFQTVNETVQVNLLQEKRKRSLRKDLEDMMNQYTKMLNSGDYEIIQLVTNFYIDFINMNVFTTDNEFIGIILCYALIFKERFNLFRYISFFELFNEHKEAIKEATMIANFNWKDGYSQTTSLNKVIINMMLSGYAKIENMIRDYTYDLKYNKSDNIENTISRLGEVFTKNEIKLKHPLISESTINRTLQRLRDENKIRPNGTGRSATWIRLFNVERFHPDYKQIDLFEVLDDSKKL